MVSNLDLDFEILQGSIDQIMHANTTGGLGLGILDMELFSPGIENQMDQVQLVKKKKKTDLWKGMPYAAALWMRL